MTSVSFLAMLIASLGAAVMPHARAQPSAQRPGVHNWNVSMQFQQPRANGMAMLPQPEAKPWHVHDALVQRELDSARVTFEFRPRSATADLRDLGTVRMQLSSQGSFSLRPRRGGVQMAWKSSF